MKRYLLAEDARTKNLFGFYIYKDNIDISGPHKTSVPHRHDFYEIWFFKKGSGTHYIENSTHTIVSPSVHFIAPENVHLLDRAAGCEAYLLAFSSELFDIVFNQHAILDKFPRHEQHTSANIIDLAPQEADYTTRFFDILEEHQTSTNHFFVASLIHTLFTYLLPLVKKPASDKNTSAFLTRFYTLINTHFNKHYQTADYATLLQVSAVILNRRVKKMTGLNVSTHIKERMILEAKRLLINSDVSIKEVAYQLGFKEASYFSRYFTKATGQSPLHFRNREVQ